MTAQNSFEPGEACKARQCALILDELNQGPVSTLFARDVLGIMSPAARIMELRRQGYLIVTGRALVVDGSGQPHRSAIYSLQRGAA